MNELDSESYLEADNVLEVLEAPLLPAAGASVDVVPVDLRHRVRPVLPAGRHHETRLRRLLWRHFDYFSTFRLLVRGAEGGRQILL